MKRPERAANQTRFSDAPSLLSLKRRNRGLSSARRAVALFNMSDISVTTVQAAVLLGTISFADSNTEAEALYYAVANRLAQILDLAHRPTTNETERQVNLRSKYYCTMRHRGVDPS